MTPQDMHTTPELNHLTLGFVPLLDAALLVIARERGFFSAQGVEVSLSRENAWSTLRDKVAAGLLDGAQMLSPMPLAMSLGLERAPCDTLAPITLSRNGNAIVLSSALCEQSGASLGSDPSHSARAMGAWIGQANRRPRLAMVYPFSCQHYLLREWLSLGGVDPDRDVELVVLPPPRMVTALSEGQVDGFCAGEPWGSLAAHYGVGRLVASGAQLWPDHPEKVLGVTRSWAHHYPRHPLRPDPGAGGSQRMARRLPRQPPPGAGVARPAALPGPLGEPSRRPAPGCRPDSPAAVRPWCPAARRRSHGPHCRTAGPLPATPGSCPGHPHPPRVLRPCAFRCGDAPVTCRRPTKVGRQGDNSTGHTATRI
ncbi:CmpA/NrtA family ABC transporter substrate-binding protein [Halomonas sp. BC04]|uniref:CmpA/NrtA family ABC transporter substrate-binding protein n=1 Tax=Halomonas sp. BC04 TaxID=1403540 RepID=UPI001E60BA6F|nr:CmpA/NrtA family ABC transporter substrate-binding protein [Halomonas sp. BC04]